jgi:ribose 5-phosphate isomerase B
MKELITESEIKKIIASGASEIVIEDGAIITALAKDLIQHNKLRIINEKLTAGKDDSAIDKIAIGSDHTGVKAKKIVMEYLNKKGYDFVDVGTFTDEAVDYPDIAFNVASKVKNGEVNVGIILDATGIPSAITANKFRGIRAATCYNEFSARSSKEHNNANVLVLGAKSLGDEAIKSILDVWLNTSFLGDRHQKRLDKITAIEEKHFIK